MAEEDKETEEDEDINIDLGKIKKFFKNIFKEDKEAEKKEVKPVEKKEESKKEEKIESALKMLQDGLNVDMICKYTGLSVDEIEKLK